MDSTNIKPNQPILSVSEKKTLFFVYNVPTILSLFIVVFVGLYTLLGWLICTGVNAGISLFNFLGSCRSSPSIFPDINFFVISLIGLIVFSLAGLILYSYSRKLELLEINKKYYWFKNFVGAIFWLVYLFIIFALILG